MSVTITHTSALSTETCCACGTLFALPSELQSSLRKSRAIFYCPNGHAQSYSESEADRLRRQLEQKERELRESKCETMAANQRANATLESLVKSERKLRRVSRGVCPCCNRSFQNLARHMATQHKDQPPK